MGLSRKFWIKLPQTKLFDVWMARYKDWGYDVVAISFEEPSNNQTVDIPRGSFTIDEGDFKLWFGVHASVISGLPYLEDHRMVDTPDSPQLVWIKTQIELPCHSGSEPFGLDINSGGYH